MKRELPHSHEAEQTVLGVVLMSGGRLLSDAAENVAAADFYHPAHAAIFEAMLELESNSKPVDGMTVMAQMRSTGSFDRLRAFGSMDYLTELQASVVTVENVAYHARTVRKKAQRRRVIDLAMKVLTEAFGDSGEDEFQSDLEAKLLELSMLHEDTGGPVHLKHALRSLVREVEQRFEHKSAVTGVPSGFEKLDSLLGGFKASKLYVIAARPAMGKSSFVGDIVRHAGRRNVPCLLFSLEMAQSEVAERQVVGDSRIDTERLRSGQLMPADWVQLTGTTARLADYPIWVDDASTLTWAAVRSRARRWRMREAKDVKHALVVVDYLQLVEGSLKGRENNREREIASISRGMKGLSKELKCPVVALSQLNRTLEQRADKRPMLSDLRESGAIEQDADVVVFIYRDEVYSKDQCKPEERGTAEIIVSKHRGGPTGMVRLGWQPERTRFVNLAYGREERAGG